MKTLAAALSLALATFSLTAVAGCSANTTAAEQEDTESFDLASSSKTDETIKREIEEAAKDVWYTSESDYEMKLVFADRQAGDPKNPNITSVRARFASFVDEDPDTDKPLARLAAETRSFSDWKSQTADCAEESHEECAKMDNLNAVLARNLRGIKAFYFGESGQGGVVNGTAVSVLIVGRTPSGNYVGVRTIAIWT